MKKRLSVLLLTFSGAAVVIRLLQQLFGFEAGTGLPIHGLLFALPLIVLAVLWAVLVRPLPSGDSPAMPRDFQLTKNGLLLPIAGVFLLALSGLGWLFFGIMPQTSQAITADGTLVSVVTTGPMSFRDMLLLGALHLVLAVCLFPVVSACRAREDGTRKAVSGTLLLAAPVVLVIRLVLVYRICSVDPILEHFAVELLALVCLTLAFYRLSGFGCGVGSSRRFALYAGWAVMLSLASLPGCSDLPDVLFYLGAALVLLGLLLPRLDTVHSN